MTDKLVRDPIGRDRVWEDARPNISGSVPLEEATYDQPRHLNHMLGFHLWLIGGQLVISQVGRLMSLTQGEVHMTKNEFLIFYQILLGTITGIDDSLGSVVEDTQLSYEDPYIVLKVPRSEENATWIVFRYEKTPRC